MPSDAAFHRPGAGYGGIGVKLTEIIQRALLQMMLVEMLVRLRRAAAELVQARPDAALEVRDHSAQVMGDDPEVGVPVEESREDQPRHRGRRLVRPPERPPDVVLRPGLRRIVGVEREYRRVPAQDRAGGARGPGVLGFPRRRSLRAGGRRGGNGLRQDAGNGPASHPHDPELGNGVFGDSHPLDPHRQRGGARPGESTEPCHPNPDASRHGAAGGDLRARRPERGAECGFGAGAPLERRRWKSRKNQDAGDQAPSPHSRREVPASPKERARRRGEVGVSDAFTSVPAVRGNPLHPAHGNFCGGEPPGHRSQNLDGSKYTTRWEGSKADSRRLYGVLAAGISSCISFLYAGS